MKLDGVHHVTAITGDPRGNVDFYTRVLGLRLVAKSVNQDDPFIYHLFFSDEVGNPGADITFFGYEHAAPGRPGAGSIHRVLWRVGTPEALTFWEDRLATEGMTSTLTPTSLRFADPEGLEHELLTGAWRDEPRIAEHPEIPRAQALQGFEGVRAYGTPERSRRVLEEVLGAVAIGDAAWELRGAHRGGTYTLDPPPSERERQGAGSIHHVAWGAPMDEHAGWVEHLSRGRVSSTPVIDRHYFQSIYFREPGGVLFEIASEGPGFARDGTIEELGTRLILPPWYESRRAEIEARLTPIEDPRASWTRNRGR